MSGSRTKNTVRSRGNWVPPDMVPRTTPCPVGGPVLLRLQGESYNSRSLATAVLNSVWEFLRITALDERAYL